jgi:diacylglycerol kinase
VRLDSEGRGCAQKGFSIAARLRSVRHASDGILDLLRTEHNARIHAIATLFVVLAGWGFGIDRGEWIAVVLAMTLVWMAEAFNTAVESLCDVASPEEDQRIKRAKDVAAGSVLISAMGALIVGCLVFLPRLCSALFEN